MKNPFKDKKILFLLNPRWHDGSAYKWGNFLKKNYGVILKRDDCKGNPDLGICWGDSQSLYKTFLKNGIPYILAEHDVYSMRMGVNEKTYIFDKEKIENATAVIFTSEEHAEHYEQLKKKYGWHIPKYVVIHNRPLKRDLGFIPRNKLEGLHLVYAGGLVAKSNAKLSGHDYYYRAYHYIFEKFMNAGWKIHLYPNKFITNNRLEGYRRIGCIAHNWVNGDIIYREMSQYTAGLHSYNRIDTPEIAFQYTQSCRPNKLYDYLASGIPTIGYDGGNGMEIYRDKWGIVIDDLEPETLKAIPERLKKIKILQKWRNNNVLEKEKDKFEYIIKVALKEAKNKNRKRYYVTENPFKVEDTEKLSNRIQVHNKGAITIYRGGYLFLPGKTSEELTVNMRTYKEIKSHVSLRIEHIK